MFDISSIQFKMSSIKISNNSSTQSHEYAMLKKLFTEEKILDIIKKRADFETRVKEITSSSNDYKLYIEFESDILKSVNSRKTENIFITTDQIKNVENMINIRINHLYKTAVSLHSDNLELWYDYVKFLTSPQEISNVIDKMLQYHGDKPNCWLYAICVTETIDSEMRVKALVRGAEQRHSDYPKLYIKFIQIELESKLSNNIKLQHATFVYENAKKRITEYYFYIEVFNTVKQYSYAKPLLITVTKDMASKFTCCATVWYTIKMLDNQLKATQQSDDTINDLSFNSIDMCVNSFEPVLKQNNAKEIWEQYITILCDINSTADNKEKGRETILNALSLAFENNCLAESLFIKYAEMLYEIKDFQRMDQILQVAVLNYPTSTKLWAYYLSSGIAMNRSLSRTKEIFLKGRKINGKHNIWLWLLYGAYIEQCFEAKDEIQEFYEEACQQNDPIFNTFKISYMERLSIMFQIKEIREIFRKISSKKPHCYDIFKLMCLYESFMININIKEWRSHYKSAVSYFGYKSVDVWLEYYKFEKLMGDENNLDSILYQAKHHLPTELYGKLKSKLKQLIGLDNKPLYHKTG